ncbi:hypothetical protein L210DRAFT_3642485 [Boletus edulis BED1]|uniref:Uncharacterized protein n=1 Tax=Boletus edulis BED1 TaxID=1328754 RepID=A0AAD4C1Z7_BOLED|nr:hypothetical protein L210DRAFT_3642485 [Boletus edulis BED1]
MTERAVGRPWTASEDQLLANAVAIHGEVDNWKAVALSRWLHSLSPNVKKTAWTREEDNLLLELYKIHSAKWAVIARNIPGRTDDACSKRYREALDPSLKKDDWTQVEDEKLIAAYNRLGGKWGRVGQELQRSGLGCRNRWRLLQRKRASTSLTASIFTSDSTTQLCTPSVWPSLPMIDPSPYWDDPLSQIDASPSSHPTSRNSVDVLGDTPPGQHAQLQLVDYPVPFHYSSSSLSSALSSPQHALRYEKDTDVTASNGRQSLLLPTASVPPDSTSTAVFAPFDYESSPSTCALSVSSTSPAPYSDDMHQTDIYSDRPHQFHQLHRSASHTAIPVHASSAHPVQVDHYTVAHEECSLSHAALPTRHQPTPQTSSLCAPSSADSYFATSRLPEQQASHVSSSITSVSLLDKPDTYYHASPEPQLDVNVQHSLIPSPDPLSLSESRPGYHYVHQRLPSRARVVETMHGQEQRGEYHYNHVQPEQSHRGHPSSRPPTTSPPDSRYAPHQLERSVNTPAQPEAGPSRTTPDHYYTSNSLHASQLVQRSTASHRSVGMPYTKRLSLDSLPTNTDDNDTHSCRPIPRQKIGTASSKRSDTQTPLRLSSDLQATPDPSIKPYACGHESCWPSDAASSSACYCTSRGLSDHNKIAHPEDSGGDRPYRCGLEGCGKSWKSINGLQYHLQISKAHFQHAITSSFVSSYITGLVVPASVAASTSSRGEDKTKKQYTCPHENCPNRYKQLSGLRYHLAHGHPVDLPKQLDLVPPALSRKLAEKMRIQGPAASSERPTRNNSSEASHPSTPGPF